MCGSLVTIRNVLIILNEGRRGIWFTWLKYLYFHINVYFWGDIYDQNYTNWEISSWYDCCDTIISYIYVNSSLDLSLRS